MADGRNYPQLPRSVWRGAWDAIRKAPRRKLDDKALAAELGVQLTAAKAYARELARIGLLDNDFTPTELANRWRQDGSDTSVIDEILDQSYPEDLLHLAPRGDADRDKVVRWFMNEGLGEGAAKNKAATYLMIASGMVDEGETKAAPSRQPARKVTPSTSKADSAPARARTETGGTSSAGHHSMPSLNVNLQIHISADASSDQIEAIFKAMRQYLNEAD